MKKAFSLLVALLLITQCIAPVAAASAADEERDITTTDWVKYFVEEDLILPEPITTINTTDGKTASFTYNWNGNRVEKKFNRETIVFYYDENDFLIREHSSSGIIDYKYENINGVYVCNKIVHNGSNYLLQYDEFGNVTHIFSEDGNALCQYKYEGTVAICFEYIEGKWVENSQKNFIGNINPVRYNGWYFDQETNCYYLGDGIYYSCTDDTYIMNKFTLKSSAPELNKSYSDQLYDEAARTALGLLNMSSYNAAKEQVSLSDWNNGKRWYDGLGVHEIVARCIYGENFHPDSYDDRVAILCVLANRIASGNTTIYNMITTPDAFTTVNPKNYNVNACKYARAAKNPSEAAWKQATIIGCLLSLTTAKNVLEEAIGGWPKGISTQKNFFGLDAVYKNLTIKDNKLYYGNLWLKDAAIAGKGMLNITNFSTVDSLLSDYYSGNRYNIFFTWPN